MNKIYIYNKDTLNIISEPFITNLEEFKKEPTKFFPSWDNTNMIYSEERFNDLIKIDPVTNKLRLKTREEKIIEDNQINLLQDGEYIENNKIIKVDCNENYYKKTWDKENNVWFDSITKDELIEIRKEKILNYENLKSEKTILENSEFTTIEEIETLNIELNNLKNEINKIALKSTCING